MDKILTTLKRKELERIIYHLEYDIDSYNELTPDAKKQLDINIGLSAKVLKYLKGIVEQKEREYCFQCSPNGKYTIKGVCEVCKDINKRADKKDCEDITCINCDNTMEGICDTCKEVEQKTCRKCEETHTDGIYHICPDNQ